MKGGISGRHDPDTASRLGGRRWEYKIHVAPAVRPSVDELDRLGAEGWELVSAVGVGELGAIEEIWYAFKRESLPEGGEI